MADLVPAQDIEGIVGSLRDTEQHIARAVSAEQRVYLLHSHECVAMGRDLRLCPYSLALDRGIDLDSWPEDEAVFVVVDDGRLVRERWTLPLTPKDT